MKKVAVVILIFILLTIAPQAGDLCDWLRVNTPVAVAAAGNWIGNTYTEISGNAATFFSQVGNWFGSAVPAMAPAATQVEETAAPSASPEVTPTPAPSATPAPTPTPTSTPSPEPDLLGSFSGQTYTNPAAGFVFDFPKGYQALGEREIRENYVKNMPSMQEAYNDPEIYRAMVQAGSIPVFTASKHPVDYTGGYNSNIQINIQQMAAPLEVTLKDMADIVKQTLERMKGVSNVQEPQTVTLDGTKAAMIAATLSVQDIKVSQRIYLMKNGGWFITATLNAADKTDLNEMAKALQTVKLAEPAVSGGTQNKGTDPGTVSGQTYTNRTGGFTLVFPAGYTATNDPEEIKEYVLDLFDAHKELYKDPDAIRQSIEMDGPSSLFIAYKKTDKAGINDEISVSMTKADGFAGSVLDFALYVKEGITSFSDRIEIQDPMKAVIGGVEGAVLLSTYKIGKVPVYEDIFLFEKNGYIVTVDLTAPDDAGMNELEGAVSAIRLLTAA